MAPTQRTLPEWHSTPPSSSRLKEWLLGEGSLTRLLKQLADNVFSVLPVYQGWQTLRDDECRALGCAPGTQGWVREVFLCGEDQPWIYARSVASRPALQDSGFDLASLGTRSLGELLFADQAFSRGAFEICNLPASAWPRALHEQQADTAPLWARRSCFSRNGLKILVAEAFLPAFWSKLDQQSTDLTTN